MANLDKQKTHVEKVIECIELLLEGKSLNDAQSYSIADRSISKMTPDELLKWRSKYYAELRNIENALKIEAGEAITGRKIMTRFL